MKVLLVVPRYETTLYQYFFPLGLAYIFSAMQNAGHDVECLNMNHHPEDESCQLVRKLDSAKYDVVASGGNSLIYWKLKQVGTVVKSHPTAPKLVLGGPIITTEPELMVADLAPDFGVIGEGERTIVDLLDALATGREPETVNAIAFRRGESVVKTKPRQAEKDLDAIPFPNLDALGYSDFVAHGQPFFLPGHNTFDYPRVYPIIASRSCPFSCTFCYHDTAYRSRSLANVTQEIENAVERWGVNMVLLYDDCFSSSRRKVTIFCRDMAELQQKYKKDIRWSCQMMVKTVDAELLKQMKKAGCVCISYGFESYSKEVLKSMRKPITLEQIDFALKETVRAGITVQANFIFGDPAETKQTAKETVEYWKQNSNGQINLGFIQPYPGSAIYADCVRRGLIKDRLHFIKYAVSRSGGCRLNMTRQMSRADIDGLEKLLLRLSATHGKRVIPRVTRNGNGRCKVEAECPHCRGHNSFSNAIVSSRWKLKQPVACRGCGMRFDIVSRSTWLAYRFLPITKPLWDLYCNRKNAVEWS